MPLLGNLTNSQCEGSAACHLGDNTLHHAGSVTKALQLNAFGDPYLEYTRVDITPGCSEKTVTTITFRCPTRGMVSIPIKQINFLLDEISYESKYRMSEIHYTHYVHL